MHVTRPDLERYIAALSTEVADPAAGIYGPRSKSWELNRESILFMAGGRAALLQIAHPFVAHGVDQHSRTREDPLGRFVRTFDNVFAMVFGDLETAIRASRRVHTIHERIQGQITEQVGRHAQGSTYDANLEPALLWVHATLIDGAVMAYEMFVRPLGEQEKEQYWQESKRFARLFGISDATLPDTWADFVRYFEGMLASDELGVGRPALELRRFLFSAPRPTHKVPFAWVELMTAGMLPPRFREAFRFSWGPTERAVFKSSVAALRATWSLTPKRLRYSPAYVKATRRLAGLPQEDPIGEWIERMTLRGLDARGTGKAYRRIQTGHAR